MGFYYRKSVKFGPFRLNFSKSGIGVSAGVRGARISTGPRGTYVHAGTNGFYYKQRIDSGRPPVNEDRYNHSYDTSYDVHRIHSADVSHFVDSSSAKLIEQINTASKQFRVAPVLGVAIFISSLLILSLSNAVLNALVINSQIVGGILIVVAVAILGLGSYLTWQVHKGDQLKRTTPLFYELEDEALKRFENILRGIQTLSYSSRIWRVQTQQSTWDWKRNAGASSLVTRTTATVRQEQPPYIATNIDVWSLRLNDQTLYFMPDYIFVRQNGTYGAISYEVFRAEFSPTRFIEDTGVPSDSRVLDYTWLYVNKNGGPDRRFSNNRQIPIVEYGFVHLATTSGLNIHLHVSNVRAADSFARLIDGNGRGRQRFKENNRTSHRYSTGPTQVSINPKLKLAYETLGVTINSTSDEIQKAYRQMVKMYHPDRLAHLAPEFVDMAEERMKEINIAYDTIKQCHRN